jgi:PKD repeat protein
VDDVTVTVNPLPAVTANAAQDAICAGQTVQLVGGGAVTYVWSPATGLSNPNTAITILTGSTTQTFILTGTDANGCANTAEVTVTVHPLPEAVINPIPDGCLDNPSTISQSSTVNGLAYAWTLGDNTTSSAAFVSHTYPSVGTYNVTLTVTDENGCQDADAAVATVVPLPAVSMSIPGAPDFCVGEPINLQNTSTGQLEAVLWNFAYQPGLPAQPSYSSSQQNPQFSYPVQGTYNVRLLGLAASGCTNSVVQTLNIHAVPEADFDFTVVCEGGRQASPALAPWRAARWSTDGNGPSVTAPRSSTRRTRSMFTGKAELMGCSSSFRLIRAVATPLPTMCG